MILDPEVQGVGQWHKVNPGAEKYISL